MFVEITQHLNHIRLYNILIFNRKIIINSTKNHMKTFSHMVDSVATLIYTDAAHSDLPVLS